MQATIDIAVPVATQAAIAFNHGREPLWAAAQLLPSLVAALVLFTGIGARVRRLCSRLARGRRLWTATAYAVAYVLLAALVSLPFNYYRDVVDLRSWGEFDSTPGAWLGGQVASTLGKVVLASLFAWLPYRLMTLSPKRWWILSATALVPVVFLVLVVVPVWVSPLTTSYKPLTDQVLLKKIETLAGRCGVKNIPVFIGGGEDTVVGLGPTNRIVLNQDIFKTETPEQIEFTIGHELKHYIEGDNWKALAILTAILFVGFFLVDRVGTRLVGRFASRIGFDSLGDPASLPIAILVFSVFWLSVSPLFNLYARHIEAEADRFGLELTHRNSAMATMFAGFATQHLQVVEWDQFQTIFYANHPSNGDRIRFANSYRPWENGRPLTYGGVCAPAEDAAGH